MESATAKYQEAMARENLHATPADARIFQRALAPQLPTFPKKIPIISFATLSGLIFWSAPSLPASCFPAGRA